MRCLIIKLKCMSMTNGHQREMVRSANLDQTMTKVSKRPCVQVPVGPHTFSAPVTFGGSSKETVSSIPAWFRADSKMNVINQGGEGM